MKQRNREDIMKTVNSLREFGLLSKSAEKLIVKQKNRKADSLACY